MNVKGIVRSVVSMVLVICIMAGMFVMPVEAAGNEFRYVSLGASNTNGYGMRGYITEEELNAILSGEVSKDDVNVYGYERKPEGAYPDLIRDYYEGIYGAGNVTVNQLAISSMRVEELRILLDETYNGDDYSAWRFTGEGGWFESAEEGGLPALRAAYKEKISNADLVTVDIGWNNFGVYVCNQLVNYMNNGTYKWTTDISSIYDTDAEDQAAAEAKELIRAYIEENVGEGEVADALTNIFAYSILGYMYNFDICMEKIYEMNPDADVVVLGVQNLLYGVVAELGGEKIALGDIFGNFVNMANYYISARSPYQSQYQYVKVGSDEHVTIFLDYMKTYNGDAENLNQNVKDCFDYYDDDLYIQMRVDAAAAALIEEEYGDMISMLGYDSAEEVVADGKKGNLPSMGDTDLQATFDAMYWPALYAAYDTLAVLVQEIANYPYVVADGLLSDDVDIGAIEDSLMTAVEDEVIENALAAGNGEAYTVDLDKILTDDTTKVVASIYIRYYLGNSFFAHPNETGHAEIKDAVVNIINNPGNETDQALADNLKEDVVEIQQLLCNAVGHADANGDGACDTCGFKLTKLEAPEIKASNVASSGKIKLTWDAVDGAEKYKVYRATSKGGKYSLMKTVTGTSYTNSNAKAGKTYYYYVVAVDANGETSEKSNVVSRMCDLARPTIKLSNVASSGKIKISWEEVEGAVKYKVYRATSKNGKYSLLKTVTGTSMTNANGVAGKTYYYKVKAIAENTNANSAYSAVKSRMCDLARPDVTISRNDNGKPKLTWDAIDGAVKYKVYRSTEKNGEYKLMKTVTGTTYTNANAKAGVKYFFKVKAIAENTNANSAYSAIDSIKAK